MERHVTDLEELSTLEEDLNEQLIKASGANYDLGNDNVCCDLGVLHSISTA